VVCWGSDEDGETDVPSLSNPTQVSSGASYSCALDDTGVVCWGWNDHGQTDVPSLSISTQVSLGLEHSCALNGHVPTQVSSGWSHACALDDSGVVCWGYDYHGQTDVPELTFTFDEDGTDSNVTSAVLDIDANGSVDALTDGLMVLRYLFGLRGQSLIDGVISEDAMRNNASDIETYIETLLP
jgi:alpha-tubulin suppressor-like RCC1 family protein